MRRSQVLLAAVCCLLTFSCWAQSPTATITGRIQDPTKAAIAGANVDAANVDTNVHRGTQTNELGLFTISNLPPGTYRIEISKPSFKTIVKPSVVLHVQDVVALNFDMSIGSTSESVTVEAGTPLINTQDGSVSTVIDRNFAENLPMNGRSFQTLIELTPGVVLTPSNSGDSGQFSVNGQRATSNYFLVDGVSANIGISASNSTPNNGAAGALPGFSAQGGTNSLVSVDALREFRIQTSTFAPEFGRTPGGQISIVTRSGSNQYHGTLFEYLRNDVFDANDWFASNAKQPKPQERQNDFGGTFSGPVLRDRMFFFFSYEGLRLRLPQVQQTLVPSLTARQNATPTMKLILNAYPQPNGAELVDAAGRPRGVAPFNASYSNRSELDATSLRLDHRLTDKLSLFARYNYSPSISAVRARASALSSLQSAKINLQTATIGATWAISNRSADEIRANYSRVDSPGDVTLDNLAGAVPFTLDAIGFPSPFNAGNSAFMYQSVDGVGGLTLGQAAHNVQRQFNLVDNLSIQMGAHAIKVGGDYRRLTPTSLPAQYQQSPFFLNTNTAAAGQMLFGSVRSSRSGDLIFNNLSVFAQDTWRATSQLSLTYGLRWDVDYSPSSGNDLQLQAVTNFNDLATLSLAPEGTPIFRTRYGNIAPRIGVAYQLPSSSRHALVLRGGFGVFYDLATVQVGPALNAATYPFGNTKSVSGGFPLSATAAAPPVISRNQITSGLLNAFDPNLKLPYVLQWNASLEQSLGTNQLLSLTYVGASGRRLLQSERVSAPNPSISSALLVGNYGSSHYDALQVQHQVRLSRNIQALASYVWSHSIDTASASSLFSNSNGFARKLGADENRGPSDFDVRHGVSGAVTYDIPTPELTRPFRSILEGWSVQNMFQARTATPVDVQKSGGNFGGALTAFRPDLIPGQPLYLFGPQYPGNKAINPAAFSTPPLNPNGSPTRQGNLGRNALRGFGAWQWDLSVHRDFPLLEALHLQFRAELFNVLNHPNFGNPVSNLSTPQFGQSIQMLGASLDNLNQGGGSFAPLYQIGGPRSVQFALKLMF